jgi:polyketide cyclase/dehydrase/lipid transport protein
VKVASSIDLPCAPDEAWRVLTRWERQSDWMADADRIELVSATRDGVGVRIDVHTRLFQVPAFTETMEVVAWDPPSRLEIVHGPPVAGHGVWELEPTLAGTRFTWTEDVELDMPFVGSLAAAVYGPIAGRLIARSQRALRALIVASGPERAG